MFILILIIEILWLFIAMSLIVEYIDILGDVSIIEKFIIYIIFIIGAPFFLIVNVLESILNCILPEGWNDDFKKY